MNDISKISSFYFEDLNYDIPCGNELEEKINFKWIEDSIVLPLCEDHYGLYKIIHWRYYITIGTFPNIISGTTFNEKIQWLKLFDQRYDIVRCSDKIQVKEYARERVGNKYILPASNISSNAYEIDFDALPRSFVIKANHDSGSSIIVRDKEAVDWNNIIRRLNAAITAPYGWEAGEWAYRFVMPKIFTEELLVTKFEDSIPDFKFFCSEGRVKFVHYIYDRNIEAKEIILDAEGRLTNGSIFFARGNKFAKPSNWDEMIWIAERLSCEFKFVRVDLYSVNNQIYVGELTFWPMYGMYINEGQKHLGPLLNFCQKSTRPPIIHHLINRKWHDDTIA